MTGWRMAAVSADVWPVAGLAAGGLVLGGLALTLATGFAGAPLATLAVALLAAAAAFTLDEPAASVVDVTPTRPVRQVTARARLLVLPVGVAVALVLAARLRSAPWPFGDALLSTVVPVLLGFVLALGIRLYRADPGLPAATTAALVVSLPVLVPRVDRWLPNFPQPATQSTVEGFLLLAVAGWAAAQDRVYRTGWR
jgi:hypothetical protein